jgi:hypothetical protein
MVIRLAIAAALAGCLTACTDPFAAVEPEAPTSQVSVHGSSDYQSVPTDFWHAMDSSRTDRIGALLSDSASFTSDGSTQSRSALTTCAARIATTSSSPVSSLLGSISPLSQGTDTVVETFPYSLYRSGQRIAWAQATWTVVRSGTEWRLLSWKEIGQDSGWAQLCRNPR